MKYYNKEIETMSRENLFALQSERLVKQVRNVYDRVPYYRAKMDAIGLKPEDIGSISDISKLPFTVKTDIRANYPFGLFGCDRKKSYDCTRQAARRGNSPSSDTRKGI